MFGGGGGFGGAGSFGGYGGGGGFGGPVDNDPNAQRGGGGLDAGGFNAVPSGGSNFGGGGFGAAPQASQQGGLGGYLAPTQGEPGQKQGQQRDQQSMMPLTLKMLLDAHERSSKSAEQLGPDAPLHVNGREISMFTFVGCIEKLGMEQIYKTFQVNDGSGRIMVKQYHDEASAGNQQDWQIGEYVRIFGTFRYWGGDFHVSAHNIARCENANEVPFHFIEVAHVHLALAGRMPAKPAPAAQAQSMGGAAPTNGQYPARAGDWQCPCGVNVFASKDSCFKCGTKKSAVTGGAQMGGGQGGPAAGFPGAVGAFGAAQHTVQQPSFNAYGGGQQGGGQSSAGGLGFGGAPGGGVSAGGAWGQGGGAPQGGAAPQGQFMGQQAPPQYAAAPAQGMGQFGQAQGMGQPMGGNFNGQQPY